VATSSLKPNSTTLTDATTAGDPHAHIHNSLWNMVVTEDGRIGSLDSQRLTDARVKLWGAYAQAELAQRLRSLGVRVAVDPSGRFAVLPAIPSEAVDTFSKGNRQTQRVARANATRAGLDWSTMSAEDKYGWLHKAAANERQSKAGRSGAKAEREVPAEVWQAQADRIGWSHKTVLEGTVAGQLTQAERFDAAYAFAAKHLAAEFHTAATLDHDMLALWAARGLIGVGIEDRHDIDRVVGLIEARGIDIRGERAAIVTGFLDGRVRVTNSVQVRIEQRIGELARAAAADRSHGLDPALIRAAIAASPFDFDNEHGRAQVAAIYAIGTGGGLTSLTGVAGAGKTTLIDPLVRAYRADTRFDPAGREVFGVATGWLQADAMLEGGVKRTFAMEPLIQAIEAGEFRPTQNTVLFVEEASQIAPRHMLRLMELQVETGFTIKLLGDKEQCQNIEAGDLIEILNRVLPVADQPKLLTTVRQKTPALRSIAGLFRDGAAAEALDRKRATGTARMLGGDVDEVIGQIADLYVARRDVLAAGGFKKGITASALTNADAADISRAIRDRLKARGEIGADEVEYRATNGRGEAYMLPVAVGDRLRLFRKTVGEIDGRFGFVGSNGDVVTVLARTDEGLTVRNKHGQECRVEWRRLMAPRSDRLLLGLGWCQTVDAIQGATSTEHINALPRGTAAITKFKGYTAESRAEWDTWTLIGEAGVFEAVRHKRALGDTAPVTTDELWAQAAQDMSRAPYKSLGMDLLDSLRAGEDADVRQFAGAAQRIEAAQAEGRSPGADARERLRLDAAQRAMAGQIDRIDAAMAANLAALGPAALVPNTHLGKLRAETGAARVRMDRGAAPG